MDKIRGSNILKLSQNDKAKKPLHEQVDDTVLPLINVVFLLLSFCLILSQFVPLDANKIKVPILQSDTKNALSNADKHIIYVTKQGEFIYNNTPIQVAQLLPQKKYVVAVSRDLPAHEFLQTMGQLKQSDIKKIAIVVEVE